MAAPSDRFARTWSDAATVAFWLDGPSAPPVGDPLQGEETAALVIVGAGFTGLWAAIQASVSTIEFDFWGWAVERWDRARDVMNSAEFGRWLNRHHTYPTPLSVFFQPYPADLLEMWKVPPLVNTPKHDSCDLIAAI